MSRSEDYLDQLLNGVSKLEQGDPKEAEEEKKRSDELAKRRLGRELLGEDTGTNDIQEETEEDFLKKFEEELESGEADEFLRDFELELAEEEAEPLDQSIESNQVFFQNIDDLLEKSREAAKAADSEDEFQVVPETMEEEPEGQLFVDTLSEDAAVSAEEKAAQESLLMKKLGELDPEDDEDLESLVNRSNAEEEPGSEPEAEDDEDLLSLLSEPEAEEDSLSAGEKPDGDSLPPEEELLPSEEDEAGSDDDLLSLLSGLGDDEELSDISDLLKADEAGVEGLSEEEVEALQSSEGSAEDAEIPDDLKSLVEETEEDTKSRSGKKKKEKKDKKAKKEKAPKKNGFFAKLSKILFGEDDEEENQAEKVAVPVTGSGLDLEDMSAENLAILKELDAAGETEPGAEPEGKKKKEKKKKEKKKKEKPPKEKKPKKPREKKEKPPKEKDNTPPLPKVPVILIFVMAVSILALVMLGSSLVGYKLSMDEAQAAFAEGDYRTAYETMAGLNVREADEALYEQARILAVLQEQCDSYETLIGLNEYAMALDCLIRGLGRCGNFAEQAAEYGITPQVNDYANRFTSLLADQFGVSAERAGEIYAERKRDDYSMDIMEIVNNLNLEQQDDSDN